ncbi:MAG: siderophore-interacting protein [Pseudonocardia sp.]|nr:siderophore-interacting protein [Pseudonocardia sp.]
MSRDHDRRRHTERLAEVLAGTGGAEVPYPVGIRRLEVLRTGWLGSGLRRLTLGGPALAGFESHVPDEHVRVIFPDPDGTVRLPERDGTRLSWPSPFPPSREYTVRRHDADTGELDLDVAVHGDGIGSAWAMSAAPGDPVHVAGPPGGLAVPQGYDRYLLAGDITALPAVARWLERMPRTARGWAFLEVGDASEEIALSAPPGVDVSWVHRGDLAPGRDDGWERAIRSITVPDGERVYAWIAGEAGTIKPLRRWVRGELGLGRADSHVTGYWKLGTSFFDDDDDDDHHDHDHDHQEKEHDA